MEAEARRQTAFAHRRGASSSQGGSRRGGFNSDAPNDRLSPAGACRGQCAHAARRVVRGTFGHLLRTPPKSFRGMSTVGSSVSNEGFMGLRRPVASPSSNGRLWFHRGQLSSAHLLHLQRSGWQWLKQCGLGFAEIEPPTPILALKDDHLAIMDRRNVRARSRGQQGEGGSAVGHGSPEPGEAKPVFSSLRELPF